MKLHIKGGRLIDPRNQIDRQEDLCLAEGRVVAVGKKPHDFDADRIIDADGKIVCPGLIDLCARLNPLESELAAAVAGGVSTIVCPPDTDPPLDEPELVERLVHHAAEARAARVLPLGALTVGLAGELLSEMFGLSQAGCVGFSQAKTPIHNTENLRRAMLYAATFDYMLWLVPKDPYIGAQGVAHDGEVAFRLGLPVSPVSAEHIAVSTLLILAAETGVRMHLGNISTAAGMRLIRSARSEGLPVSCDVSIYNLLMSDTDIGYFDTAARFEPPLRSKHDMNALQDAVVDGVAVLCSDHTPLFEDDKLLPFATAGAGASGLELLLPLTLAWASERGLPLRKSIACLTDKPSTVLGQAGSDIGDLGVGQYADACIIDPRKVWEVNAETLLSCGKNTPWQGRSVSGRVVTTIVGGEVVYENQALCAW